MPGLEHWIVTADARRASLFAAHRLPGGRARLEPLETLENRHEDEHEHHRPMEAGGAERRGAVARSGAHAAPHMVAESHTAEEEEQRFAREVCEWLAEARKSLGGVRITVFAPPRFLGLLRRNIRDHEIELNVGELSGLSPQKLGAHAAVRAALK